MSQPSYRRRRWLARSWPRRAALAAVGVVAGAPLVAAGAAAAGPVESGRQVTFSGSGLLGVSCAANPSTGSVTIAAETTLRVVNRTGHRATLVLDGSARGEVVKGGTAEVLFHRGPVLLTLKPHCVLTEQRNVRIQVVVPRPAVNEGPAGPAAGGDQQAGDAAAGSDRGSTGRAGLGPAPAADTRDGGTVPLAPGVRDHEPDQAAGGDVALDDNVMGGEPAAPSADAAAGRGADLAAEPVSSVEPVGDQGPIGLLALIATICLLGVSVGAIRAILAQRASRAELAVN